jgi:hypothetical protein
VTGGWRKLHNEELHNLYSSPSIIIMMKTRRMRWTVHVALMERREMHIGYWCGKPEGKRPQGIPKCRCVDDIRMDFREMGWSGMGWIHLA